MGLLGRLRRKIAGDDETATAVEPPAETAEQTTIDDAAATSLRAIKLPESERQEIDAEEREPK